MLSGSPPGSLCKVLPLRQENAVAIGDSENNLCLLRAAGQSVALNPRTPEVEAAGTYVLRGSLSGPIDLLP